MMVDGYKRNESITKFKTREYCNRTCLNTDEDLDKLKLERGQQNREEEKRQCEVCRGDFIRGRTETRSNFLERFTCGNKCAGERRRRQTEEKNKEAGKTCANPECGKTFYRRTNGETWTRFNARDTCSAKCGHANRRSKNPNNTRKSEKTRVVSTLPPVSPPPTYIPPPPTPTVVKVWRPDSWGGSYIRQVS